MVGVAQSYHSFVTADSTFSAFHDNYVSVFYHFQDIMRYR